MRTPSRFASLTTFARAGALSAGLMLAAAPAAWAQEAINFNLDGGLVFWTIKPDRTADFEYVVNKYKEALLASTDPAIKGLANGWKVYKVQEPAQGGNVFYLFLIDPAVKGGDYSSGAMLKLLYAAYPAEAKDLYTKLTESAAGGRNVLNLQRFTTIQ
jgi:hypothetical protein